MGYCMDQRASEFTIKAENMAGAIAAVKALDGAQDANGASGYSPRGAHYAWVDNGFGKHNTIEALMGAWRWCVETGNTETGDFVERIYFEGEKSGDDMVLFKAIAPFVEPGSYIEMVGEDGYLWRFYFDGKTCVEQEGKTTFE